MGFPMVHMYLEDQVCPVHTHSTHPLLSMGATCRNDRHHNQLLVIRDTKGGSIMVTRVCRVAMVRGVTRTPATLQMGVPILLQDHLTTRATIRGTTNNLGVTSGRLMPRASLAINKTSIRWEVAAATTATPNWPNNC